MRDISFLVAPIPDHAFFRRRSSSACPATTSLRSRASRRKPVTSPGLAARAVSPASRFLPASKISTSYNTSPERFLPDGKARQCCLHPAARRVQSGSFLQLNIAYASADEYPSQCSLLHLDVVLFAFSSITPLS